MKYLSLFSGIEAASQAWQPLGWQPVAFAEIEPFPCVVLAHHYPEIPNLGDVTTITQAQIAALGQIDVVVGGSPCIDFSIAGKRAGIAGKHSGLFHELVRIFHAAHTLCGARYLVWENVPGTLSVHQGRDFALVAGTLAGCDLAVPDNGWGTEGVALGRHGLLEWAVLDAQWFGLAQRRKRLFAVLDTGRWADRPPILLERDSVRGDCPARGTPQQGDTTARLARADEHGGFIPDTSMCLNAGAMGRRDFESETFVVHGTQDPITSTTTAHALGTNHGQENVVCAFDCRNSAMTLSDECAPTLCGFGGDGRLAIHHCMRGDDNAGHGQPIVTAFQERGRLDGRSLDIGGDVAYALTAPSNGSRTQERNIQVGTSVRRLTPRECERLQGFPDDFTRIAWRGKPAESCPDGPRYKALGNSMAVPVMRWIGEQIDAATRTNTDNIPLLKKAA